MFKIAVIPYNLDMHELNNPISRLLDDHQRVLVAFSGGRDSAALLHALAHQARVRAAGNYIVALYVNHNLQEAARDWPDFAASFVAALVMDGCPVELVVRDVFIDTNNGESVEALARDARYTQMTEIAAMKNCSVVALGHHRKDQVETFMLQALRGSGVAGLAAMPSSAVRDDISWERPWLKVDRRLIDEYVVSNDVLFVEDPTNSENAYARNKLRNMVLPVLTAQFPDAEVSIAQTAQWCAEAADAMLFIAQNDLLERLSEQVLDLQGTESWPEWRKKNLVRHWYHKTTGFSLPVTALSRLIDYVASATSELKYVPSRGSPDLVVAGSTVYMAPSKPEHAQHFDDRTVIFKTSESIVEVPECGGYWTVRYGQYGVDLPLTVTLGQRRTGLQFQKGSNQPARSIKNQFQAAGISASERNGPYLYKGEQLVWAPGLGLDARVTKKMGWVLEWHNGPAPTRGPLGEFSNS